MLKADFLEILPKAISECLQRPQADWLTCIENNFSLNAAVQCLHDPIANQSSTFFANGLLPATDILFDTTSPKP